MATSCHFDKLSIEELALVTSEICENTLKHAEEGVLTLDVEKNGRILVIQLKDKGPGIADVSMAMEKGFSSVRGSLGLGLDIVQRLMDEVTIHSEADQGTSIILKKFLPLTTDIIDYGLLSIAADGYLYNGDRHVIKEFDGDSVLLAVIDGVGQGFNAYLASNFMEKQIEEFYRESPEDILEVCHEMFINSKMNGGAAIGIAKLFPGKLQYAGIGDTHAYWIDQKLHVLRNIQGSVGNFQFKKPILNQVEFSEPITLCLCTDGIKNIISRPSLEEMKDAQMLAKMIYNRYARSYGDVTTLVANYKSVFS